MDTTKNYCEYNCKDFSDKVARKMLIESNDLNEILYNFEFGFINDYKILKYCKATLKNGK